MPRNSPANIRTGPSPAASDTTCRRKPRRPSPTPSSTPTPKAERRSVHVLAAVQRQRRARDETALVGDQEQHAAGDLVGIAEAADGDARHDLLQHVGRHRAHHVGVDVAWRDRVHGDALAGAFLGQRLGEAVNAGFGGGVIHLAVLAGLAVDRADVDDAAEAALAHALDHQAAHVEAGGEIGGDDTRPTAPGSSCAAPNRG